MENLILKRTSLFIAGMILAGVAVCIIATRNTFRLGGRYQDLQSSLKVLENIPVRVPLDMPQEVFHEVDLNAELFKLVSESARSNNVKVKNLNAPFISSSADVSLLTKEVILEGGFTSSLKCLQDVVRDLKYVKLSSVTFEKDPSSNVKALYTRAYFQTIKKNDKDAHN